MKTQQKEETKWQWTLRNSIALIITVFVIFGTFLIAWFILRHPEKNGAGDLVINYSFIGQTLLPLWGTWLGTVLAYYFGKANFEAGSNAVKSMTPESKMASLMVKDVMLPQKAIKYLDYDTRQTDSLETILVDKDFESYNRFAVFDKNKGVKAMINRGTFYEFMHKNAKTPAAATGQLTLKDLLDSKDENIKNTLSFGFGFVRLNATVLDAKKVIDSISECQNVFITQNGSPNEPVLGLLTNNKILEMAKV